MSDQCIFCRIIKGEIKADVIFEDEKTLAFLDSNPLAKGHSLVVPKHHFSRLEKLDNSTAEALFQTVFGLIEPIQGAVNAPACNIALNNGKESGQNVPHVHVHIIPRFKGDKGTSIHAIMTRNKPKISKDEMKKIAENIRKMI